MPRKRASAGTKGKSAARVPNASTAKKKAGPIPITKGKPPQEQEEKTKGFGRARGPSFKKRAEDYVKKTYERKTDRPYPNGVGRPKKELDWGLIEEMLMHFSPPAEIAQTIGVSIMTLLHRSEFLELYKRCTGKALGSIRRAQYEAAVLDRNPTMLIWMGKQYLGQKDDRTGQTYAGATANQLDGAQDMQALLAIMTDDEMAFFEKIARRLEDRQRMLPTGSDNFHTVNVKAETE
jgi:hypothetical protein